MNSTVSLLHPFKHCSAGVDETFDPVCADVQRRHVGCIVVTVCDPRPLIGQNIVDLIFDLGLFLACPPSPPGRAPEGNPARPLPVSRFASR
jgi:hypothetical protein